MFQFKKYNPGELANHHNRLKEEAEKAKNQIEKAKNGEIDKVQTKESETIKSKTNKIDRNDKVLMADKEQTIKTEKIDNVDMIDDADKKQTEHLETTNGTSGKTTQDPKDESRPEVIPQSEEIAKDDTEKVVV